MSPHLPRPARRFRPEFSLAMVNVVLLLLLYFLVAGDPAEQTEREHRHQPCSPDLRDRSRANRRTEGRPGGRPTDVVADKHRHEHTDE